MKLYQYDTLLGQYLGEMGPYQYLVATLCSLDAIMYAFYTLMPAFIASTPPHVCFPQLPSFINCTLEEYHTWVVPQKCSPEGECNRDACQMYTVNTSMMVSNCSEGLTLNTSGTQQTESCTEWKYGDAFYSDNAVKEWDLVCDNTSKAYDISGVYMLGRILGSILVGFVADSIGRRKTMLGCTALTFVCALTSALVPNFYIFLFLRFLLAALTMARSNVGCILGVEVIHSSRRTFFVGYWSLFWVIGSVSLAGLAYFIQNWRYLHIVCAIPEVILFILHYVALPESPRWLVLQERKAEAVRLIERMARVNKKTLPEHWELDIQKGTDSKGSFLDLIKAPRLRLMTIVLAYLFFANCFVYYGLTLNSTNLAGNEYLNFFISGAVEVPPYLFVAFCYERMARRPPFCLCLLAGGLLLLSTVLVPEALDWVVVLLSMTGKFFISCSFVIVWLVVTEVFPTAVRGTGLGVTNSAARVASVLSAYVMLLTTVHTALPVVVFSASAMLAGLLVLVIPETSGTVLPQTVQDGEGFIKDNMCNIGICKRKDVSSRKTEGLFEETNELTV